MEWILSGMSIPQTILTTSLLTIDHIQHNDISTQKKISVVFCGKNVPTLLLLHRVHDNLIQTYTVFSKVKSQNMTDAEVNRFSRKIFAKNAITKQIITLY